MISFRPRIARIKRYGLSRTQLFREVIRRDPEAILKKLLHSGHRFLFILSWVFLSSCATTQTHFMETLDLKRLKDGTYIGEDLVSIPPCSVKLATTLKEGKITDIKILSHFVSYPLAGRAYDIIPKRIIERQSLDVDAITAATVSTNNVKRAAFKALEKATMN